jgi:hypothetical protein
MNALVPFELMGQGAMVTLLLLSWLFSFTMMKFALLLIMATPLAIQGMRCESALHALLAAGMLY